MRTLLIIVVALVLLGGGWYWYSQQNSAPAIIDKSADFGTDTSANTGAPQGQMEDGTIPENSNPAGVNVDASATVSTGATKSFTVTGQNFSFIPSTLSVRKGDTVKITFKMASGTSHDFVIDEFSVRTNRLEVGDSQTVTFVADKSGSFEYYCSVGQHRVMGMKGTLTVTP